MTKAKKKKETPYARWYAKNKEVLAERRKQKYYSDPEHRKKILAASKEWRRTHSRAKPTDSEYPLYLTDVAELLDVNPSTIRDWQGKSYFPTPKKIGGAYRFTTAQANLLTRIKQFFDVNGSRKGARMPEFDDITSLILANW